MNDIGKPLQAEIGPDRTKLIGTPVLDPKHAAAEVLQAYLQRFVFETEPGEDGKTTRFRLAKVTTIWPSPGEELEYPSASIDEGTYGFEAHNLVPTMLEETADCFEDGTVLWKTAEVGIDFQVDFWTNNTATRRAIRAGLPRMFSPGESRSGVLLTGNPRYFDRPVRATYMDTEDIDTSRSVYEREHRLRTTMRCDMDVVHLRGVTPLQPKPTFTITDNS